MFTAEMRESIKKVEATRQERLEKLFGRMTADEKQQVLRENHPDYIDSAYEQLTIGANKGDKVLHELADLLQGKSRVLDKEIDLSNGCCDVDVTLVDIMKADLCINCASVLNGIIAEFISKGGESDA